MKLYVQLETHTPGEAPEIRPRALVLETGASLARAVLDDVVMGLGRIAAVPAVAHEHNLLAILPRDLAARGVPGGEDGGGEMTLRVIRTPGAQGPEGQADVIALDYEIVG